MFAKHNGDLLNDLGIYGKINWTIVIFMKIVMVLRTLSGNNKISKIYQDSKSIL